MITAVGESATAWARVDAAIIETITATIIAITRPGADAPDMHRLIAPRLPGEGPRPFRGDPEPTDFRFSALV
jgi:hypothetical protein